jgi:hypothetical protein
MRRHLGEQSGHHQAADALAPVLGRHPDAGHAGHRHLLTAPPLPHVVEHRAARQPVTGEGAQAAALGDEPGHSLPPVVAFPGSLDPEGPLGQVQLRVDVVTGEHQPDLDPGIPVNSHEHPPYASPPGPVTSINRRTVPPSSEAVEHERGGGERAIQGSVGVRAAAVREAGPAQGGNRCARV